MHYVIAAFLFSIMISGAWIGTSCDRIAHDMDVLASSVSK